MKKVLFRAPVLTQSGYGVHARQVLRWLKSLEEQKSISLQVQILPWGDTPWFVNPDEKSVLIGYAMTHTGPLSPPYDVTLQLQLPNEWDPSLGKVNIGMSAGVETTRCHPDWIKACNRMTKVIVPSVHSSRCFLDAESRPPTTPITVVPESYIDALDDDVNVLTDVQRILTTSFNVIVHGQITGMNAVVDRKNIFNTIKWLCELFKNDTDFGVILKTNMAKNTLIDRQITTGTVASILSEVRRGSKVPPVYLVHGDMSDTETAALYRLPGVKALVSLSRGEGFGLPILEAARAGLPVIATNWSAYTEFLGDKFIKVDYRLCSIPKSRVDGRIFIEGAQWAESNEIDFKSKMKMFRDSPTAATSVAKELSLELKKTHSWNAVAGYYVTALKDIVL